MAFSAIHPVVGRIDATASDLGCGLDWNAVHKTRPRIALTCPECGHGVHAKVSSRKLRYFAHDPGRPDDCAWLNESLDHHLLKLALATAVRAAGWDAQLEVTGPDGTWRADVLARNLHEGDQFAWEAQLSPITDDDISARTERYWNDDVDVCWVSTSGRVPWIDVVPAVRVADAGQGTELTVADGVATFNYARGRWNAYEDLLLSEFVTRALRGQALFRTVGSRYRRIWSNLDRGYRRRAAVWTSQRSLDAEARHETMRQRQDIWRQQQAEQEQRAEQQRKQETEDRRQEEERQREIAREAERVRLAALREEQERQWAIEREERQRQQEADERRQRELAEAAEQERLRREREEYVAAQAWWKPVSAAQFDQFRAKVIDHLRQQGAIHVEFDSTKTTPADAYGVVVRDSREIRGVLRPSPASLHRLSRHITIFARNAREAALFTNTGKITSDRVIYFDLPEEEQLSLL
ncbi:MAG: competence protein CoiA family protein [Actinophytocola sp.]|uniref:competence protein CoiA n=1 Tax=Actinophytocola sp. TaxID=1872138 RepID=UPI003C758C08